ncbi:DUF4214 domain-containing protein [Rhizobium oryzicola]|uniref:DUF4214 domain-containing protein n=1 Tax=Rhizobium oryzicola TaxID=1232668 RepID=A0ABT8SY75_9HYPH|nr:DUF4214 domain-containing protein [Rhizobium oryzicola]MDO1583392.1 DUF4214 domain-containing protein [Rhizobium oryzicola]
MASIQGVYVALFARPADPAGLAYFNSVTGNGADLSAIGDLAGTKEYQDRFAGQSNTAIVSSIYQSLFNRPAEAEGAAFFVDQLAKGALTIKNIAIAILDGAQGDDLTIVTNKLAAANNFTNAIDTPLEVGAYTGNNAAAAGRAFVANVTRDASSVPGVAAADKVLASLGTFGSGGGAGVTIQLTTADDIVSTNAANPALRSTAGDDTIVASAVATGWMNYPSTPPGSTVTLSDNDVVDGGAGNDTFIFKVTGGDALQTYGGAPYTTSLTGLKPALSSIEKIVVTAVGGKGGGIKEAFGGQVYVALNLENSNGYKEVWSDGSQTGPAGSGSIGGSSQVAFYKLAANTVYGLKGVTDFTSFFLKDSGSANDTATLKLDSATSGTVQCYGIENLTINVSGTSTIGTLIDPSAQVLKIIGGGDFTLTSPVTSAPGSPPLRTIDASGASGRITISVGDAGVDFTGSTGVDTVTLGAKTDTVFYTSSNISTVQAIDTIKAFTATGSLKDRINVSALGLSGDKSGLATFAAAPVSGSDSFNGKAAALFVDSSKTTWVYFDTNGNNVFDAGTDLAVRVEAVGGNAVGITKDNIIF